MGAMPGDILDAIDGALEDWSTSEDAMRWKPELRRVICDGGKPLQPELWNSWRHARFTALFIGGTSGDWVPVGTAVAMSLEWEPSRDVLPGNGYSRSSLVGPLEWNATVTIMMQAECREQIAAAFGFSWEKGALHYHPSAFLASRADRHHCPLCNPHGNPRRLPINGREYARRRAARKKRR
jgi:hypothetical protein